MTSMKLSGLTVFVTGGSRGVGKAIALRCAQDGANVAIAAKTAEPHPKLPGTIYTAAKEVEEAGGRALPCIVDIRDEQQVQAAVADTVKTFGGIDILVNNASAISLTNTLGTDMKKYDLMTSVNVRGTFMVSKACLPYLKKGKNPHILNLSPPLNMNPVWFSHSLAYTMSKYGMSMVALGLAEELKKDGVAVNALWPKTAILTSAMEMLGGGSASNIDKLCRTTDIVTDAAHAILTRDSRTATGNFYIDEEVLAEEGVTDFEKYSCHPGHKLLLDFFLGDRGPVDLMQDLVDVMKEDDPTGGQAQTIRSATTIGEVFAGLKTVLSEDLIQTTQGIYQFDIDGSRWYIDLKTSPGAIGEGDSSEAADSTFSMSAEDFIAMYNGTLDIANAFMSGKMLISGNMGKAMQLEKVWLSLNA